MNTHLPIRVQWPIVASLIVVCLWLPGWALADGGGSMSGGGGGGSMSDRDFGSMPTRTPQEIARSAYNDGVRAVKQADKYEADALKEQRADRKDKGLERAKKQYEKARGYFATAVDKQPSMHEAWNYIGYTSRKMGESEKALVAYGEALRLSPGYTPAIEYRGVAYLTLNRLDEAKDAYMTLFRDDREQATKLMAEMQGWVAARRSDPAGVSADQLDGFAKWVTERSTIAQQTAALGTNGSTVPWN